MKRTYRGLFYCTVACCCVLVQLFFSHQVSAQRGVLTGTIYDSETGESIPYANIIVDGTLKGTYSNDEGKYRLELQPGQYLIRYTSISFKDTLITVTISSGLDTPQDVYLQEDQLMMEEIVVSADRVTRKVQQLASLRDRQQNNLKAYTAEVYKLAILGSRDKPDSAEYISPVAYSERVSLIQYTQKPERFSETLVANRSSKNFFSEYDFFSTGGQPLNLNQDQVPLSILSEDITVAGPISQRAGRFYDLTDTQADDTWPAGTIEITITPRFDNRPLFQGKVWYDDSTSTILGVDVWLNDYANTNSGLFSISNLRYQQTYTQIDEFWLPKQTKLSATLSFIGSNNSIEYLDEWTWQEHKVNPENLDPESIELNTSLIMPNAHKRKRAYWDTLSTKQGNENLVYLEQAKGYTEKNRTLRLGMSVMSKFFRLPYELERFYLTNIDDIYHYNRVEGHYLGLGLRTPVHSDYQYKIIGGYGFATKEFSYKLSAMHYIPGTAFAPDINYQKQVYRQYQDYEYNTTPIDFFGMRQTMNSLFWGTPLNNYFGREGLEAGFRYRFDVESFLRVLYLNETHTRLQSNTDYNVFGHEIDLVDYPNNSLIYPAQNGELRGVSVHLHHDTRKYLRTQFLRDYNIRDFGWLIDAKYERGVASWGSDFDYNRYRFGLKLNIPVFSSHFIQTNLIVGASDAGTPHQRLFNYNGFVLDDYVRERYMNTTTYKQAVGTRVTELKVRYKFGSSITRKAPIAFIQKSGIHLSTFASIGYVDGTESLTPLLPNPDATTQAEIGISAFKVLGFLYFEFSKRILGDYGNSIGFIVLF